MKSPGPSVSGAWLRRPVIPGAIEYHPGNGATGCALTLRKSSSASPIQPGRSTPSTRPDTAALTLSEHTFFWGRARGGGGCHTSSPDAAESCHGDMTPDEEASMCAAPGKGNHRPGGGGGTHTEELVVTVMNRGLSGGPGTQRPSPSRPVCVLPSGSSAADSA